MLARQKIAFRPLVGLAFAALIPIPTTTCGGAEVVPDQQADAATYNGPKLGARHRMTCQTGMPSIGVEDKSAVAKCPGDGNSSAILMVVCAAGPPLLATTEGEEILVLCPEDVAPNTDERR
jgi:hypothetical protein